MQNPVTGSGGMLVGVVEEVGPESPLGLRVGDQVATLVSLSLTPLAITDGLAAGTVTASRCPRTATPSSSGRSIAAVLPADLPAPLAMACSTSAARRRLTARGRHGVRGAGERAPRRRDRWRG
jgi:L-erythro-3,5-diaminohexanoate dehydrogenase